MVYLSILQESWIQHATVRENILFGKEFKADKYEKVIQACALQQVVTRVYNRKREGEYPTPYTAVQTYCG